MICCIPFQVSPDAWLEKTDIRCRRIVCPAVYLFRTYIFVRLCEATLSGASIPSACVAAFDFSG
jgi:hypothetical protein